ncbi:hypothetical protein GDO86_013939 [Hymenochirus boettgeri]|uniref:Uncharacterized protein n=1 Tax=Hymenochirus boettgeri TaxID=247094 RepID=A0A8T2JLZ6_9PIPI|nr:hypothetical protein GDO86_013939 [Hymenochirus boettgeri]KAG8446296.1 hypothetical protein GDO86_013939 [Hymenochirus boettgeri]
MKLLPLLLFLVVTWTCCEGNHVRCKDPSQHHLQMRLIRLAPEASLILLKDNTVTDVELKKCPKNMNHTSELPQDRSISPWSYRTNEDLNRYPQKITEAYCLCEGCISIHNKQQNSVVSVPFYKEVPILHKTPKCKRGRYIYKLRYIKIAQFCICRFHKSKF